MRIPFLIVGALLAASSCLKLGKPSGTRASGQSRLMDQSFAGQNACNPNNHARPFIIEWDATDASSFESHAANDIVVVRYEGCMLTVLDECRNDSIRGQQGAYRPPEWTSGSLERIDISNEGELFAKLPLAQASLGGRVSGGEGFHMEYYVAGTRNATRDSVYQADLADNPGCAGATHFVYAYNLGAFALGSRNELKSEAGLSAFGFGAGVKTRSANLAEKKGGDLRTCTAESATEVQGCKAPIRLALRKIREGEDPDRLAERAPDSDASLNAAGKVAARVEVSATAQAHFDSAIEKLHARDGKGCLAELNRHAKLDPKHASTDPKQPIAMYRAQCLMLAGKCDAGKQLLRKHYMATVESQWGPEQTERSVESTAAMYCEGKLNDRDAIMRALTQLNKGAFMTKLSVKSCETQWATIERLRGRVKPISESDEALNHLDVVLETQVPACLSRAGDCDRAWAAHVKLSRKSQELNDRKAAERTKVDRSKQLADAPNEATRRELQRLHAVWDEASKKAAAEQMRESFAHLNPKCTTP